MLLSASPGQGAAWTGTLTTKGRAKSKGNPTLTFTAKFQVGVQCVWTTGSLTSTFNTDGHAMTLTTPGRTLKLAVGASDPACPVSATLSAAGAMYAHEPARRPVPISLATNQVG